MFLIYLCWTNWVVRNVSNTQAPPLPLTVFGPHLSSPPPSQCLLCANSCLVLFCCLCQAPWWTIDCSSGWVQPQQLSSCLSLSIYLPVYSVYPLSPSYLCLCLSLFNNTIISSWGLGLRILSLLASLSFSLLLFLSHPSTHPTSFSITVAWCLLAWRLPTGATGGLRSSELEQNLSRTNKMLMNDNITATLNRHFSDSLYLCLSLLGNYFLFMIVFLFISVLCGYADSQFEKTGGFFQSCFILLHVKWWRLWALLFYL